MSSEKPPQRWRENIEALTMAVVVALLFKYFVLEISKIPSGSMQPTLMGSPEAGVFDRTVVDKLSFRFRDPERFEIVVFKHPLERSRIMVKRLVGLPGEELRIEHGDLWTRTGEDEPWRHLRRPEAVQRGMWRELRTPARGRDWSVVRAGKDWQVGSDELHARGDGAARYRADDGPILDGYLDGYPQALLGQLSAPARGRHAVGDLRLSGKLSVQPGTRALSFELTEGQRTYEFTLPGPLAESADGEARVTVRIRDSATGSERVVAGEALRLPENVEFEFALENLDDQLRLDLDGRTLLATEIEASVRQEGSLTVALAGGGADLRALRVFRDVYYLTPEERAAWTVRIPAGHYVMLGDNTQDSADSRLWYAKTYAYQGEAEGGGPVSVRGNYREGGENPSWGALADGTPAVRFRDHWGEMHWFARTAIASESLPGNAPLVPRELILGRALAVFWPIRPVQGLWRLGWLR